MKPNAQHSNASSEWYTPASIVCAAHDTLSIIDLDPCSNAIANSHVDAQCYFDVEMDGLSMPWGTTQHRNNVFLNPPGRTIGHNSKSAGAMIWWTKLMAEIIAGNVARAIYVAYSVEQIQQSVTNFDRTGIPPMTSHPICFPRRRLRYLREVNGELVAGPSPTHSSAIVGVGVDLRKFINAFSEIGPVMIGAGI